MASFVFSNLDDFITQEYICDIVNMTLEYGDMGVGVGRAIALMHGRQ